MNKTQREPLPAAVPSALADVAWLDIDAVCAATCMGKSWIRAKVAANEFPQPHRLGMRCTRWTVADIREWLVEQSKGTDKTAAVALKARGAKAHSHRRAI